MLQVQRVGVPIIGGVVDGAAAVVDVPHHGAVEADPLGVRTGNKVQQVGRAGDGRLEEKRRTGYRRIKKGLEV